MGYIYKITNKINNKVYIGQTTLKRASDRFTRHKYQATHLELDKGVSYIHRAMADSGIDNFEFTVIEEIGNDKLNEREKYWIQQYNSLAPNGYNLTSGGQGTPNFSRIPSQEEKERRSESCKHFYEEHPEKIDEIRERTQKLWEDPDYRKRVTESNKKFYSENPDMFRGENNPMYGKHHTKEALEKIHAYTDTLKHPIVQLDKDTLKVVATYDGIKDAERALKVSHGWLSKAARQGKVAYGYRWKIL